jgi:hypothetical protein
MRSTLCTLLAAVLTLTFANQLIDWSDAAPDAPPAAKGLVVHEWGVFRVHEDVELANADMRAIWEDLPPFVYGQVSGRDLPKHWQNIEPVDKPVLFFYANDPVTVNLRIDFPTGTPAVWWPGTQKPGIHNGALIGGQPNKPFKALEWSLLVKEPPKVKNDQNSTLKQVGDNHWVKTLRDVGAEDIYALVGERGFGAEREKFVYYDGLLPRGKWVKVRVEKEDIGLLNQVDFAVLDVTVVDRRIPGKTRVARLEKLDGKAESKKLDFEDVEEKSWTEAGTKALLKQLKDAGLLEKEAASLVELWKQELFATEGVAVFYRLPQEEYDRLLPLTMTPRAEKIVRVGLVMHPHCEPDLGPKVAELVKQLNADDFAAREEAQKRLEKLGRAAYVHLIRMERESQPLEVRARLEKLLQKYDSQRGLPK